MLELFSKDQFSLKTSHLKTSANVIDWLKMSEEEGEEAKILSSLPEIEFIDQQIFLVKNFSSFTDKRFVKFTKRSPPTHPEIEYGLTLWPNGMKDAETGLVIIYIWLKNNGITEELTVKYELALVNLQKVTKDEAQVFQTKLIKNKEKCTSMFKISRDYLMNHPNDLLHDDNLHIYISIIEINGESFQKENNFQPEDEKLFADFNALLESGDFSDITLVADGKEFKVHKAILVARSPFFVGMFTHDTKENKENEIKMPNMSADVCQELLRYIYSGKVKSIKEHAKELLALADQYNLNNLKIICAESLCKNLTIEIVAEMLKLSDMLNVKFLKKKCFSYITEHADEVCKTESWKALIKTNPEFGAELFEELALRHSVLKKEHAEALNQVAAASEESSQNEYAFRDRNRRVSYPRRHYY